MSKLQILKTQRNKFIKIFKYVYIYEMNLTVLRTFAM